MLRWIRDCSLTLALLGLFALSLIGQAFSGRLVYNEERRLHGLTEIANFWTYVGSSHFLSALFENWESEFLQMGLYVWLTVYLFQRGSSESNPPPDERQEPKEFKRKRYFAHSPWLRKIYENSLFGTLMMLFVFSFLLHARESLQKINEENSYLGKEIVGFAGVFLQSEFWFESFQNWQSEFFSVAVLVVLSIFLRQKDSAQSKDVDAPHLKTGS